MIFTVLVLVISFFLDGFLTNFLPYLTNDLSLVNPLFTVIAILIIYPFFKKEENKYLITVFILGFLYDLFYTNLLFTNAILFLLVGLLYGYLYKKIEINIFTFSLLTFLLLIFYQAIYTLLLYLFNIVPITLNDFLYLILHSLILNIIYGDILYLMTKQSNKKRRLN